MKIRKNSLKYFFTWEIIRIFTLEIKIKNRLKLKLKLREMKKITFLLVLLISFLLFSCEKPLVEETTPPAVVKVGFTATASNVTIYNGSDGKITITVTAGTAPYTYQLGTGTAQSTNVFSGLKSGSYNVTVADSKSQTLSKTVEVTQPAEVILPLVFTLTSTNVSAWDLSDGSITTNVTSGMPPYSYSLSNGSTNSTGVFTNLLPGNYTVTVTDNKQQAGNKSIEITQPAKPQPVPVHIINSINGKTEISGLNLSFMQNRKSFSISFWYNTPAQLNKNKPAYSTAMLLSSDHSENPGGAAQIYIEINKAKMEYVYYKNITLNKVTLSSSSAWSGLHHMVVLYDGNNMKMYLDNALINSTPSTISLYFNKMYLGGDYQNSDYDYNGTISKVKFYDKALTPDDVDYLFKN